MTFAEDMQKGRELYKKRNARTNAISRRVTPNRLAVGIGTLLEQFIGKFSKKTVSSDTPSNRKESPVKPYLSVVVSDFTGILERICSVFPKPKRKVVYDTGLEIWKRNRNQ
jgi:hypothetical protein